MATDREINLRALVWFASSLVVVCGASAFFLWHFSGFLRSYGEAGDPLPPALAAAREPYEPPGPRLQAKPEEELIALRAREDSVLETYGWVDEAAGIARIPIARAIGLALGDEGAEEPASETTEAAH